MTQRPLSAKTHPMSEFHRDLPAPAEFPLEMLREIAISPDPERVAQEHGFIYDDIKDLPHYRAKLDKVVNALMMDGELTTVIAGIGLHTAIDKLANRVNDDRISTGDLVKSIEVFKKVKDGLKEPEVGIAGQGVSLVINIPAMGAQPAQTIEVSTPASPNIIDVTPEDETEEFKINV